MDMNDTRTDLMRAVIESPDDDTPRLILADWLEENGEEERAEFIRVQCQLASRPKIERSRFECAVCGNVPDEEGMLEHGKGCYTQSEDGGGSEFIPDSIDDLAEALRSREQYLLGYGKVQWCPVRQCFASPHDVVYRRGFIESIRCSYQNWQSNWKELLEFAPIRKVTLTTRPLVERRGVADLSKPWHSFVSLQGCDRAWSIEEEERPQDTETILKLLKWEWPSIKEWGIPSRRIDYLTGEQARRMTNLWLYGTLEAPQPQPLGLIRMGVTETSFVQLPANSSEIVQSLTAKGKMTSSVRKRKNRKDRRSGN